MIARAWNQFFVEHPLILSPIWTQPPFPHGWDVATQEHAHATMRLLRPVMPANLLGLPAAAVPAGQAGGLPVGVQVMGARFQELACLEAAEAIEAAARRGAGDRPDPGAFRPSVTNGSARLVDFGSTRYGVAFANEQKDVTCERPRPSWPWARPP